MTAYDQFGNVATGYTGTVRFTSNDPQAVLPASYTFTATDAGTHHTFSATLNTVGIQSITATDSVTATITGSTSVTVNPLTSAVFIKQDTNTQGNWIGAYGSQGFNIIGDATSYPSYSTVTAAGETYQTWVASTTDSRALENAGGSGRIAASWYANTSFTVNVNLTDGQPHDVTLYILDWAGIAGRSEQIQITSAATKAVLDTQTITNFSGGVYLQWELSGSVVITVKGLGLRKALLSGLFFDPPSTSGAAIPDLLNISSSPTTDTTGAGQSFTVTAFSPNRGTDTHYTGTIHFTSSDPQAVLPASYTFTATDAGTHTFSATLNTVGIQSITATDSVTATITGSTSVTVNPSGTSAVFIKQHINTQGNWIGAYGSQGFNIIGDATSYPSYATVTAAGETYQTWVASTTDSRALENAGGSGRIAASWYANTSFTVNVNLTDGEPHDVTLYILDWAGIAGRSEQIQITSAATGAVLDTQTLTNFSEGVYLQWELSGSVVIRVEGLGGRRALLSGLFFDPLTTSNAVPASRLTQNITVQGSLETNAITALDNTTTAFADPADSTVALNATSASLTSLASLDATEKSWIAPLVDPSDGSSQAVNVPWSIRGPRTMKLKPPGFRKSLI